MTSPRTPKANAPIRVMDDDRRNLKSAGCHDEPNCRAVYLLSLIFTVAFAAALLIDLPVARFCLTHGAAGKNSVPGDIRRILNLCEVFAHGFGVLAICLTIWTLDVAARRRLPRLLACVYLPGLATLILKLCIARIRPAAFVRDGAVALPDRVWETFTGWFPWAGADPLADGVQRDWQSFPSGHTTTAVGLAIGLAWLYPRGRWLFATFALLAALQRIVSGAHFASDTFAGAAVTCLLAGICLDRRIFGRWFNKFEAR